MQIDVQLDSPIDESGRRARELVECGVDGLFTFEGTHDVFLPLALASQAVEADLMTNIAVALPRSPLHLAHLAYDMQVLSRGSFRLGLGSQTRPHIERRYGATWSRPAARMRETVQAVTAILDAWEGRSELNFEGEFSRHTLMPPNFNPGPNPYGRPEICLGALGPVMTRTAAEVADALLVMPFNSGRHFRERTVPAIEEGLRRSGRDWTDFSVYPQVIVAAGRTEQERSEAADGVRKLLAFYGTTPAYRPVLAVHGWDDLQPRLHALSRSGDITAMTNLITDDVLDTLAVRGTPEECAAQINARFSGYARRVCCYFPGYSIAGEYITDLVHALKDEAPKGSE